MMSVVRRKRFLRVVGEVEGIDVLKLADVEVGPEPKATCSRYDFHQMKQGLSDDQVSGTAGRREYVQFRKRRASFGLREVQSLVRLQTAFVRGLLHFDEGKVPFLMSLLQMKTLGVSLDLRGTPERIIFRQGFLEGQGVPHRNHAGHWTCMS